MVFNAAKLGTDICQALGLDPETVVRFSFDWAPGSIGMVQVKLYVTEEGGERVAGVLKRYKLVEKE